MRVAVAVSPPLLAELLRTLLDKDGLDVAAPGAPSADIAVTSEAEGLDADITIIIDGSTSSASIIDRVGHRSTASVRTPHEIVHLVRAAAGA